jgi:hypothetical protein
MKIALTSIFVLSAAGFLGWAINEKMAKQQSYEITVLMTEKGLVVRPVDVLFSRKRPYWDI